MGVELALGAVGLGTSLLGSRSQSRAIDRAQRAQDRSAQQALNFARETRDIQLANAAPFREFGLQQANFLGEIFGFNPVGQGTQAAGPVAGAGGGQGAGFGGVGSGVRPYAPAFRGPQGLNQQAAGAPRDGNDAAMGALAMRAPMAELAGPSGLGAASGTFPVQNTDAASSTGGAGGQGPNAINTDAQQRAQDRFQGSLFYDALQGNLGRAATGVDAQFAAAGDVYSGAREQAQSNTAADLGLSALGQYVGAGLGQPSTSGAQMSNAAAGQFGANAGNIALQQGQNQANSAYAQGQNSANLIGNLGGLAAWGLGQFGGGKPGKPGGGFFG